MVRNSGNSVIKEAGYVVEKIVDKRITVEGKVEYFIKWRGYPNSENSWEPEENCDCPAIIQKFEESRAKLKKRGEKKLKVEEIVKPRGYERGLKLDRILGATDATVNSEICYLVKWENCLEYDLVPSFQIQERNPEILIDFYEKHSFFAMRLQERLKLSASLSCGAGTETATVHKEGNISDEPINKSSSSLTFVDNVDDVSCSKTSEQANQVILQNKDKKCHDNSGVLYSISLSEVDQTTMDQTVIDVSLTDK